MFNSEKNKETVEYFKTLLDKGYMSAVPVDKLFESGRAAFKFDGAWEVNTIYTSYVCLFRNNRKRKKIRNKNH